MAQEPTLIYELIRYINEVIYVIEQGGGDEHGIDFANFRRDYLSNVVARYVDELDFGAQVLNNIIQARDIIIQEEQDRRVFYHS